MRDVLRFDQPACFAVVRLYLLPVFVVYGFAIFFTGLAPLRAALWLRLSNTYYDQP